MEGTIGEIRMFGGTFAPRNWAFCSGQLLSISQNTALFSILGTTYGGNGQTTFALPDFRGRFAVQQGQGPGLSTISLGQVSGTETTTLIVNQLPAHNHTASAAGFNMGGKAERPGTSDSPVSNYHSIIADASIKPYSSTSDTDLAAITAPPLAPSGGSQPFPLRNPYLGLNHIICLFGIFPSRN
jgi:microcystin-dependent protein